MREGRRFFKNVVYYLLQVFLLFVVIGFDARATITKTIGATGDYTSITAAWAAIPGIESPITQPWVLELKSDYSAASETFPVNLTAISGASATNTITIRPQSGVAAFTTTSATVVGAVIKLNGCSYVTIDGRAGGAGAVIWSIENTSSTNGTGVVNFTASATYNTIQYCTLLNGGATNYACVNFVSTGGNNNNTVDHCNITKSTGGNASTTYGIMVFSGTADNITVSNNNVYDFVYSGITCGDAGVGSGTGWTITGNSIYLTASLTLSATTSAISIGASTATGNATVTGNYIGGTSSSCGGGAMTTVSAVASRTFYAIWVNSNGGSVTISNNTIQNINHTGNAASASFKGILSSGTSTFTIGSSGNGNTIGATTGTGSITVAGSSSGNFVGVQDTGTGSNTISYNSIGAIALTSTGGLYCIYTGNSNACSVTNNTIGNATALNISSSANNWTLGIWVASTGSYTITSNTIRNFSSTGGNTGTYSQAVYGQSTGTVNCQSNTISTFTSNSTATGNHIINLSGGGSGHTVSNNTITSLSYTGATADLGMVYINCTTTTSAIAVQNNTFGNSGVANDIDVNSSSGNIYGVVMVSSTAGVITCSGNNLYNFRCNGSSSNSFFGFYYTATGVGSSISSNTINKVTCSGTFYGVYHSSTATTSVNNNTIGQNAAGDITLSKATSHFGIYFGNSTGGAYTSTGNTIQGITLSNVGAAHFYGIATYISNSANSAVVDFSSNTFRTIAMSAGTGNFRGIYHDKHLSAAVSSNTYSSNSFSGITHGTGSFIAIYIDGGSTNMTVTANSNTIGAAVANSIQTASGSTVYGIYMYDDATFNSSNNTVQNITISGAAGIFRGYYIYGNSITSVQTNTISTITSVGIGPSAGIYLYSTATSCTHTISSNTINTISIAGTAASSRFHGIYTDLQDATSNITLNANTIGLNSAGNITSAISGVGGYCNGMYLQDGTITCTNNIIQGMSITGNGDASLTGISVLNSTAQIDCQTNTIRTMNVTAGTGSLSGINATITRAGSTNTISSNTLSDFNCSGGNLYGIVFDANAGTISGTISSNTVGSSTANNMVGAANTSHYGLYFSNATGGVYTSATNTIQNFNLTSTGSSNVFSGIDIEGGTATLTSNTISTIGSASTSTASTGALAVNGIYLATGGHTLNLNTITNLSQTSTGGAYSIAGINSNNGSGTNTIKKTKVTGTDVASTTATSMNVGIFLQGAGSSNSYNNVILLNNGTTSNGNSIVINGIRNISTGTTVLYHNTSKVYGTATSNSANSAAYYNGGANTVTIRNNIFQNVRTNSGGTGKHYAIQYATNPTTVTAEDYNYLEASGTGGYIGYYAADQTSLANWQAASSTGTNNTTTTSLNINASGQTTNGTVTDVVSNGTDLNAIVTDDYAATVRPDAPCRGAFECPVELPVELLFFSAKYIKNNGNVVLNWATASENQNDYFEIERSSDGNKYEYLMTIDGAGNSTHLISYQEFDNEPIEGLSYYRLKQTDIDGHQTYSAIQSIEIPLDAPFIVSVHSNPGKWNEVVVHVEAKEKADYEFFVTDEFGREINRKEIENQKVFQITISELLPQQSGLFFLTINAGNYTSTHKILLRQ